MCEGCSIAKNRDEWAKYAEHVSSGIIPDMMDLCKMCDAFQESIYQTIEEHEKIINSTLAKVNAKRKKIAKEES